MSLFLKLQINIYGRLWTKRKRGLSCFEGDVKCLRVKMFYIFMKEKRQVWAALSQWVWWIQSRRTEWQWRKQMSSSSVVSSLSPNAPWIWTLAGAGQRGVLGCSPMCAFLLWKQPLICVFAGDNHGNSRSAGPAVLQVTGKGKLNYTDALSMT